MLQTFHLLPRHLEKSLLLSMPKALSFCIQGTFDRGHGRNRLFDNITETAPWLRRGYSNYR